MSRRVRITVTVLSSIVVLLIAVWLIACYIAVGKVIEPRHHTFDDPVAIAGKPVENVTITTEDGINLSAWYVKNVPDRAVVFLSGIGSDRRQFNSRAEYYLSSLGYSVLMPDLRGTGKSGGDLVSIGWHERKDLKACRAFLRDKGYPHIGAHGISLGAATICYSLKEINDFAFVILESSYDTMQHAFYNRLDLHDVPHFLVYPGNRFLYWRMGARPKDMEPVACMDYCTMPAFIMGGDAEGFLKLSETMDIYNRCVAKKKRLHIFKDGHHENFLKRYPEEFKGELKAFLDDVSYDWKVASN